MLTAYKQKLYLELAHSAKRGSFPMSIVEIRGIMNKLIARKHRLAILAKNATEVTGTFTEAMCRRLEDVCEESHDPTVGDWDTKTFSHLIGTTMPILSVVYMACLEGNVPGNEQGTIFDEIARLAKTQVLPEYGTDEPSLEGWSEREISAVVAHYQRTVNALAKDLRDADTGIKYILGRSVYETTQPGDLFAPTASGQRLVFTVEWLSPFIGAARAEALIRAIENMRKETCPRDGEPPSTDYFGSHVSNHYVVPLPAVRSPNPSGPKP
jgi:hypothetical protein